jgi:hypothetical protein
VVHGPLFRGGLGLTSLDEVQVVKHFNSFQSHMQHNDDIGKGLKVQLMVQQLETGCGDFFLNTNPSDYPYVTKKTRLGYLWRQCYRFSITVTLQNAWIPSGYNNAHPTIMDYILQLFPASHKYRERQLRRINACHLYLKVLWVDDLLLSPTDTEMNTDLINGIKINTNTNLEFPYQAKPSESDFVLWKDSVHRSLCIYRNDITGRKAIVRSRFTPSGIPMYGGDPQCDYKDIVKAISAHPTLSDKFKYLPSKFKDIIGNINLPDDDGTSLVQALKSGNAVLASDGSYLEHKKLVHMLTFWFLKTLIYVKLKALR